MFKIVSCFFEILNDNRKTSLLNTLIVVVDAFARSYIPLCKHSDTNCQSLRQWFPWTSRINVREVTMCGVCGSISCKVISPCKQNKSQPPWARIPGFQLNEGFSNIIFVRCFVLTLNYSRKVMIMIHIVLYKKEDNLPLCTDMILTLWTACITTNCFP